MIRLYVRYFILLKQTNAVYAVKRKNEGTSELLSMKLRRSVYFVNQGTIICFEFGKEDCIRLIVAVNAQEDLH